MRRSVQWYFPLRWVFYAEPLTYFCTKKSPCFVQGLDARSRWPNVLPRRAPMTSAAATTTTTWASLQTSATKTTFASRPSRRSGRSSSFARTADSSGKRSRWFGSAESERRRCGSDEEEGTFGGMETSKCAKSSLLERMSKFSQNFWSFVYRNDSLRLFMYA